MNRRQAAWLAVTLAACGLYSPFSALGSQSAARSSTARLTAYSFELVAEYTRPRDAYTQGLELHRGRLFESTGQYGESSLRETLLAKGVQTVVRSRPLPDDVALSPKQKDFQSDRLAQQGFSADEIGMRQASKAVFGEGLTVKDGLIFQITWVEGLCFVWDIANWTRPARTFRYEGEGWGLTHDATHLIMSDGSDTLYFRNPKTFAVERKVRVLDMRGPRPVANLNELELIDGKIYANLYMSRRVAVIDPRSGEMEGLVFFDGRELPGGAGAHPSLLPAAAWDQLDARGEVLNGLAYDAERGVLLVTGKRWPRVFEVRLKKVGPL